MNADEAREGVALAFALLDNVGSSRLRQLVDLDDPLDAWASIVSGRPVLRRVSATLARAWAADVAERGIDPRRERDRHCEAEVGFAVRGGPRYPGALLDDRAAPGLLVWRGEIDLLDAVAVSVVGTRRCTRYGRDLAHDLGADLANAGIAVTSGLALGIDGAVHEGALSVIDGAPPIGVVGSGLDRVYPRRHATLWREVGERGLLLTEAPLGVRPDAWRFPSRNRVIAAIGAVTVVVESGAAGGSMHTVREADDRGRTVMAVPGSVRSDASLGTNQLLADGCPPCRDVDDVLVALGLGPPPAAASRADAGPELGAEAAAVADALHGGPATLDELLLRTGQPLEVLSVALEEALDAGAVVASGGWYERVDR